MNLPGLDLLPQSQAVDLLAGAFLLAALFAASRRRALGCIAAYRINSLALGGLAFAVAHATGERAPAIAALLVLIIKAGIIPTLLERRARARTTPEPAPRIGIAAGSLLCGGLVVMGFHETRVLFGSSGTILASCLPVAVSTTLVGLFLMVSRRSALLQVVGLTFVENAIFLAAISITSGMPLIVEMGVLLDLLAGVALLGIIAGRLEETLGDDDTSRLRELRG